MFLNSYDKAYTDFAECYPPPADRSPGLAYRSHLFGEKRSLTFFQNRSLE